MKTIPQLEAKVVRNLRPNQCLLRIIGKNSARWLNLVMPALFPLMLEKHLRICSDNAVA